MKLHELRKMVDSIPVAYDDIPLVTFDGWDDELTFDDLENIVEMNVELVPLDYEDDNGSKVCVVRLLTCGIVG